jgi:hypothetical protein
MFSVCHRTRILLGALTVKHVTTNNVTADQAIIADCVTTGGGARNVVSPDLLAASSVMPMPILDETRLPDPVGVEDIFDRSRGR